MRRRRAPAAPRSCARPRARSRRRWWGWPWVLLCWSGSFEDRGQRIEPGGPEAVIAIEPAERLAERAPRQVHAVQPSVALARDQPRLLEHAHVPGDRGRRHVERLG